MLVLWRKPLNVETADYVQIPWVWPRGILPKTQKRSNAPRAGHAFATNPLLSPWVALGLPGGRPLGIAADTRITLNIRTKSQTVRGRPTLKTCGAFWERVGSRTLREINLRAILYE